MCSSNNTQVEIAKNVETRKFCNEFDEWFWETNYKLKLNPSMCTDIDLYYLCKWLGLEGYEMPDSITIKWNNWDCNKRIELLVNSYAVSKLCNFFETAKQMHKSTPVLLDVDHFKNAFISTAFRLERTTNPSADSVIMRIRERNKNPKIYDGYRYCTDEILYERMEIEFGDNFTKKKEERKKELLKEKEREREKLKKRKK
jgi:hypothetical protein